MKKKELIFLLLILFIASFFRLWQLSSIPPGLYPDVAINGNDALEILKTGKFKVFYPENNGREGLFMWLIALSFSIFGVSIWSIKFVAAAIGILTVLGLYLLTKELFRIENLKNEAVALLASFFLATSFWHTNFSRIGFRAILVPFVLVFGFYFLFKGFREKKLFLLIISGVFFGSGFYTYISYRFIVLLLPLVLIFWFLIYQKQNLKKQFIFYTLYFILSIFIVALPIGIYFLQNPKDFFGRAAGVSIFNRENPIKLFGESLIKHLAMFNFKGDFNWRHNFSGSPMLFWPLGILFLVGFILSFGEIFKKSNYRDKNYQLLLPFYFLLLTFFAMLSPGILTSEGIPHALRIIGTIPTVYIFAGMGTWRIYEFFYKNTRRKKLLVFTSFFFLLTIGIFEFNKYFFLWAKNPEVEGAFSKNYVDIGNYLNSLSPEIQKYVIVNQSGVPVPWPNGLPMPAQTVIFIEKTKYGEARSVYLLPNMLDQIKINNKETIIVPMSYDQNLFTELGQKFPEGEIQEKNGFWIYKIK